ncbi:molecular chaperone Hsp90 [Lachnoclostridium sp. An14]|uniref:molecular chaperone Hsp90 n=1 Tax=Lachnoclostridium sp. An14 TaxID=1965562 RepID=UPI000B36D036|nr:molecular chaperone Hsp90 [Lachnoclostridium sp. An14]OUQ13306.1 molecular chaperone Hsp90 [Lachnoclostridium sp. An14]
MDKKVLDYVVEKTKELMGTATCSAEAKAAAQAWLDAVGTAAEAEETKKYIAELEGDIMPIDMLIDFSESDAGKAYFGADTASGIAAHGREIKAAGAKFCDCPACAVVAEILEKKDEMLA